MQDFRNCRQCKNLWKFLDYSKMFSYPIKTWQKVFIPHVNVAKYFGTPLFHSTRIPGIKNDRSLTLSKISGTFFRLGVVTTPTQQMLLSKRLIFFTFQCKFAPPPGLFQPFICLNGKLSNSSMDYESTFRKIYLLNLKKLKF